MHETSPKNTTVLADVAGWSTDHPCDDWSDRLELL